MIEIAEVPSLKKLDRAMRQNEIAFKKSPAQFGRQTAGAVLGDLDENVQAIYVITSPTQLRGAIRMLSRNAAINAFPLPTSPANDQASEIARQREQRSDQTVNSAQTGLGLALQEDKSVNSFPNSFAQQLPSNFRLKANLDPIEKFQILNSGQAGAGADDGISNERSEAAANDFAEQSIPDAIPAARSALPAPQIPNQTVPGKSQIPSTGFQADLDRLAAGRLAARAKVRVATALFVVDPFRSSNRE